MLKLYYRQESQQFAGSKPSLVFIPGAGAPHQAWQSQLSALGQAHHCLAFDLPGTGQSPWSGDVSLDAIAASLDQAVRQAGVKTGVAIGTSMGSILAQRLAALSPGWLKGLVLLNTWGDSDHYHQLRTEALLSILDHVPFEQAARILLTRLWSRTHLNRVQDLEPLVKGMFLAGRAASREVLAAHFRLGLDHHFLPQLRQLEQPALVVSGAADQMTPPSYGREVSEALPRSQFLLLKGDTASHLLHIERRQEVNQAIARFVEQRC